MASFTLIGQRVGRLARITWDDGVLSGDPACVAQVQAAAKAYDGKPVGASFSPTTTTAVQHLASPTSAYTLMRMCFLDSRPDLEGTVPGLGYDDVGTWDGLSPDDGMDGGSTLTEPPAEDRRTFENPYHDPATGHFAPRGAGEIGPGGAHERASGGARGGRLPEDEALSRAEHELAAAEHAHGLARERLETANHVQIHAEAAYMRVRGEVHDQMRLEAIARRSPADAEAYRQAVTGIEAARTRLDHAADAYNAAQQHQQAQRAVLVRQGQTTSAEYEAAVRATQAAKAEYEAAGQAHSAAGRTLGDIIQRHSGLVSDGQVNAHSAVTAAHVALGRAQLAYRAAERDYAAARLRESNARDDLSVAGANADKAHGGVGALVRYADPTAHAALRAVLGSQAGTQVSEAEIGRTLATITGAHAGDFIRVEPEAGPHYSNAVTISRTSLTDRGSADFTLGRLNADGARAQALPEGSLIMSVGLVESAAKTAGSGRELVGAMRQVQQLGVQRIYANAARAKDLNGYYTWAQAGGIGYIPSGHILRAAQAKFGPNIVRVDQVVDQPGGLAWWREHGDSFDVQMDLMPGGRAAAFIDRYTAMLERHAQRLQGNSQEQQGGQS